MIKKHAILFIIIMCLISVITACSPIVKPQNAINSNVNTDNMAVAPNSEVEVASNYLKNKGYSIVSTNGQAPEYILTKDMLVKLPYNQIWGVQQVVDASNFIGKKVETYKFTVTNHPLDNQKGNSDKKTVVWVMLSEKKAIGGYSLPDEKMVGGVYSIEGKTLEEVTGLAYQEWVNAWDF